MDRIETVARAMCVADDKDPDAPIARNEAAAVPQWTRYEHQARKIVAAQEAMLQDGLVIKGEGDG